MPTECSVEQALRMENSREGVADCKILMILITLRRDDRGFLKLSVEENQSVEV